MKVKAVVSEPKLVKVKKTQKSGKSSLNTAVKNVKQILKEGTIKPELKPKEESKVIKQKNIIRIKGLQKIANRPAKRDTKPTERGVIYIGHIPHGFFEDQIRDYFTQFGRVTNVRVERSKKTGQSKGFAFVEFLHTDVAKIAAESMMNYLMFGRLIKTEYIEPEKQHNGYFKGYKWTEKNYPRISKRKKAVNKANHPIPNVDHPKFVKKSVKNLTKLSQKLKAAGIDLDLNLGQTPL